MATQSPSSQPAHPAPFIHHPTPPFTHKTTLILLHGTSQTGPELASTLLSFPIPSLSTTTPHVTQNKHQAHSLPSLLPNTKFLFPTGALKPTTVFNGKQTHAWFDIHAFSDRTLGESDQVPGLRESVVYLSDLVKREVEELVKEGYEREEAGKRVVIAGFSAGCAVGVILGLSGEAERVLGERGIGGFVGMSGWLPFRRQIQGVLERVEGGYGEERKRAVVGYLRGLLELDEGREGKEGVVFRDRLEKQMLLCHGEKDQKAKYQWGGEMKDVLVSSGINVSFKSYSDLEHWFNEDEMRDVVGFLESRWRDL
jgi:predicted esterase